MAPTPPTNDTRATLGSTEEINQAEKNIHTTKALKDQLERNHSQYAEVLALKIRYQKLKFKTHSTKLCLRRLRVKDHADSVTMRLKILARADKRLLKKLQQQEREEFRVFAEKQKEYASCIEGWGEHISLSISLLSLEKAMAELEVGPRN